MIKINKDCFALKKVKNKLKCDVITDKYFIPEGCENCRFYKTKEEFEKSAKLVKKKD